MLTRRMAGLSLGLALLAGGAAAASAPQTAAPVDADTIMDRMEARNPSLQSFQARVHVGVHMKTFPWLAPNLDGTAYFKRPDNYEVVFDSVPSYAHGVNKLFGNVGDPVEWKRDSDVSYEGVANVNGHPELMLRLVKKLHSDQVIDSVAYVDPANYQVIRMDFHYTNGGIISMTQTYKNDGRYNVIASQHADIHIPHVHAVADATFGTYQTNVAVNDAVFTKQ